MVFQFLESCSHTNIIRHQEKSSRATPDESHSFLNSDTSMDDYTNNSLLLIINSSLRLNMKSLSSVSLWNCRAIYNWTESLKCYILLQAHQIELWRHFVVVCDMSMHFFFLRKIAMQLFSLLLYHNRCFNS